LSTPERARPGRLSGLGLLICCPLLFAAGSGLAVAQENTADDWAFPARLAEKSLLLDMDTTGQQAIAVGERGHVLVSTNGGESWTQAAVPTRRMLCAVDIVDENLVWVAGHDAIILHSRDGGQNWSRQYYAPEVEAPLFDIWFENSQHGIAVGAYGLFLETFDGGHNWQSRSLSDEGPHHFALAESPAGILYLAGEFGTIFTSTDQGRSWQICNSPYHGSFFGVLVLRDESVLVFGLRGNLYRSTDHGNSWQQIDTGTTAALTAGAQRTDGTVIIVGLSGCLLTSSDGGLTFNLATRPGRDAMAAIHESAANRLVILGEDGLHWWEVLARE